MPNTKHKDTAVTPRQMQILRATQDLTARYCYSPTIAELASELTISRSTAYEHIVELRRKRLLCGSPGKARSLKTTAAAKKLLKKSSCSRSHTRALNANEIPLLGRIAAGLPVEAVEDRQSLSMADCFGGSDDVFALQVAGDSMIDAGICDGDYVVCKKTDTARDGQIVVALTDNENATLKKLYKEKGRLRLEPANSNYEPIYTNHCIIQGVAIGLVKKL